MNNLITFFVCFAIFFRLFNPIRVFISGGEALVMLIPIILIIISDIMFLRKSSYYLFFVIGIITFLHFIGVDYYSNFIPKCIEMSFAFFCLEHFLVSEDRNYAKGVLYTSYVTLAILILFSIPQFISIPNLSRILADGEENADLDFAYYWTISYVFIHHLPVFQIPLFALFQFSTCKLHKYLSLTGILLIAILMIFADATTPLLLTFFTLLFFVISKSNKSIYSLLWKFVLIGLVSIVFSSNTVLESSLRAVQPVFQGSSTYKKIDEMVLYLRNKETSGDMEMRKNFYQTSFNSFLENPLYPEMRENVDRKVIGMHSAIFDNLVAMGLFLFVPFFILLYERYARAKLFLIRYMPYHIISYLIFIIMGCTKNYILYFSTWFIVPIFLIYLETKAEDDEDIIESVDIDNIGHDIP